jgi:hypothetical protein
MGKIGIKDYFLSLFFFPVTFKFLKVLKKFKTSAYSWSKGSCVSTKT